MRKAKIRFRKFFKGMIFLFITANFILFIIFLCLSFYYRKNNPEITSLMKHRIEFNNYEIKKLNFIPVNEVSNLTKKMIIKLEDPGFMNHHGIHIWAIWRAFKINWKLGYKHAGGSTITQQLARTLFLNPSKSYMRKYVEIILAISMDTALSKDRIMELYLNYIEFGPGIFGIENGSAYNYNKRLIKLNKNQTMKLLTIISSPIKYNTKNFHKNKHLQRRYNFLKKHFNKSKPLH